MTKHLILARLTKYIDSKIGYKEETYRLYVTAYLHSRASTKRSKKCSIWQHTICRTNFHMCRYTVCYYYYIIIVSLLHLCYNWCLAGWLAMSSSFPERSTQTSHWPALQPLQVFQLLQKDVWLLELLLSFSFFLAY